MLLFEYPKSCFLCGMLRTRPECMCGAHTCVYTYTQSTNEVADLRVNTFLVLFNCNRQAEAKYNSLLTEYHFL